MITINILVPSAKRKDHRRTIFDPRDKCDFRWSFFSFSILNQRVLQSISDLIYNNKLVLITKFNCQITVPKISCN